MNTLKIPLYTQEEFREIAKAKLKIRIEAIPVEDLAGILLDLGVPRIDFNNLGAFIDASAFQWCDFELCAVEYQDNYVWIVCNQEAYITRC